MKQQCPDPGKLFHGNILKISKGFIIKSKTKVLLNCYATKRCFYDPDRVDGNCELCIPAERLSVWASHISWSKMRLKQGS